MKLDITEGRAGKVTSGKNYNQMKRRKEKRKGKSNIRNKT